MDPDLAASQRLERGRGAAEHERAAAVASHAGGDLAGVVARRRVLLVGRLVLLVDDDEAGVGERREERRPGADDHVRLAPADEVPLVEALARREARVEDGDVVAEAAAEAADRLGRERDLGNEHEGAAALFQRMFDGVEVDLRLARARDAVDEHDVADAALASRVNGGEGLDLAVRELLGSGCGGRGERRALATAHLATVLDGDDASLRERGHGRRRAGNRGGELDHALRTLPQGLHDLALTARVAGGREGGALLREARPAHVDGTCLLAHEPPGGVGALADDPHLLTGSQEQPHRVAERAGVLVSEPGGHAGCDVVEGGLGENLLDGEQLGRVDPLDGSARDARHVADHAPVREGHEHGGAHGDVVREGIGHGVGERAVEGPRGNVENDARMAHGSPSSLRSDDRSGQSIVGEERCAAPRRRRRVRAICGGTYFESSATAALSSSVRFVASQVKSGSLRPKWP